MALKKHDTPKYCERQLVYEADRCQPLRQAVACGEATLHALVRHQYPGRKLKRHELPGVVSFGHWNLTGKQSWGLPWHRNEGIELTFLETGKHYFQTDQFSGYLKPNDMTITRPWQPHRLGNPYLEPGLLHFLILDVGVRRPNHSWHWPKWIVLSPKDLNRLTEMLRHNEQSVWHTNDDICHCFQRIGQAISDEKSNLPISRLIVLVNELLVLMLEMLEQQNIKLDDSLSSTYRTVELFLDELARSPQLLARPWSVKELAGECNLGITHFTRYSKRLKNATPMNFLNGCRLQFAAAMLKQKPKKSITQIALEVGFSSSQYFANQFHQQYGCSPSVYRKKIL